MFNCVLLAQRVSKRCVPTAPPASRAVINEPSTRLPPFVVKTESGTLFNALPRVSSTEPATRARWHVMTHESLFKLQGTRAEPTLNGRPRPLASQLERDGRPRRFVERSTCSTAPSVESHALHDPVKRQKAVALDLLHNVFHEDNGSTRSEAMRDAIEWLFGRVDADGRPDPNGRLCTNHTNRVAATPGDLERRRRGITLRAVLCGKNKVKDEWNDLVHEMVEEDMRRMGEPPGLTYHSHNKPGTP